MENKENWKLNDVKNFLKRFAFNPSNYYMIVIDKENQKEGYATITETQKILVENGSEEKIYTQKDFKEKFIIEDLGKFKSDITIENIEMEIDDLGLDSEYGEALAKTLMKLNYISNSPLTLSYGTSEQRKELERVWKMPLNSKQIKEIIQGMVNEMKGDYQYGRFSSFASKYIEKAQKMERGENLLKKITKIKKQRKARDAR